MGISATAAADDDIPLSRQVFEANSVRYQAPPPRIQVESTIERHRDRVERAIELFDLSGLELPPLVIRFAEDPAVCEGNLGTFRTQGAGEPAIVSICTKMRLTLVHELAHAWDSHALTEDRRAEFLSHWNLDNWNDRDDDWHDRGSERAAHTIAYTLLLDSPTDNPDVLEFVCGYGILTGRDLPDVARDSCRGYGASS
jgi:hypothetical protein